MSRAKSLIAQCLAAVTIFMIGYYFGVSNTSVDVAKGPSSAIEQKQDVVTQNKLASGTESSNDGQPISFDSLKKLLSFDEAKALLDLSEQVFDPVELDDAAFTDLDVFVRGLDEQKVEAGLSLLFPNEGALDLIDDKKRFASSLLRELSSETSDIEADSQAQIYFSLDQGFPVSPTSLLTPSPRQKIYAHVDLHSGLGLGESQLYIRWKNLQTKEILLFTNKSVNPSVSRHWVSLTPGDDWQNHPYEVTFYRFNAGLDKLATAEYVVALK